MAVLEEASRGRGCYFCPEDFARTQHVAHPDADGRREGTPCVSAALERL